MIDKKILTCHDAKLNSVPFVDEGRLKHKNSQKDKFLGVIAMFWVTTTVLSQI